MSTYHGSPHDNSVGTDPLVALNQYLQSLPGNPTANWQFVQGGPAHAPTHTAYLRSKRLLEFQTPHTDE